MPIILKVAIPVPIRKTFDYLPSDDFRLNSWIPGCRVRVPFGPRTKTGVLIDITDSSELKTEKLKRVLSVIDERPLISSDDLDLLIWAAHYYHHPIGEVISTAFPAVLRNGRKAETSMEQSWFLTDLGKKITARDMPRAHRQIALI